MNLAEKVCVPCAGGVPALTAAECEVLLRELPEWAVVDGHHLSRTFRYPDFISALAFVNRAAGIATIVNMTLDELERDYVSLRQQSEAVRSYL